MNHSKQNIIDAYSDKEKKVWTILGSVNDPEIPVVSVVDLGIVREVKLLDQGVEVIITPTYSGCPAMDFIGTGIKKALSDHGFNDPKITHRLSPAWTTDWMTEEGREKLQAYGIAPPSAKAFDNMDLDSLKVICPHCHSMNTKMVSQFGSTSCKALYQCRDCSEPFDYFKCH